MDNYERLRILAQTDESAALALIPLVIRRGDSIKDFIAEHPRHPILCTRIGAHFMRQGRPYRWQAVIPVHLPPSDFIDFTSGRPCFANGHYYRRVEDDFVYYVSGENGEPATLYQRLSIDEQDLKYRLDQAISFGVKFTDISEYFEMAWSDTIKRLWLCDCLDAKVLEADTLKRYDYTKKLRNKGGLVSLADIQNAAMAPVFPGPFDVVNMLRQDVRLGKRYNLRNRINELLGVTSFYTIPSTTFQIMDFISRNIDALVVQKQIAHALVEDRKQTSEQLSRVVVEYTSIKQKLLLDWLTGERR